MGPRLRALRAATTARARCRGSTSVCPPRPPVPTEELVSGRRAPRARRIVRECGPVAHPSGDDRVDERPLLLDLVDAREEGGVAEHCIEDQPLVCFGEPGPERSAVEE